jgi:hypothetical protein
MVTPYAARQGHHASIMGRAYALWAIFWEGEGRLYGKQVARWRGAERRIVARERAAAATVAAAYAHPPA